MSNLKSYRACFVPLCTNNTKRTPEKLFLIVPRDAERRNQWFQSAGRINPKNTSRSHYFCCEDHFDLKEDMENYNYYITMGGRARIKVDVIPRKFTCQQNHKNQNSTITRPAAKKRRKQIQILQEFLTENTEVYDPPEYIIGL